MPFNFEIEDPSGNSFIQNPNAPNVDIACVHENYTRSIEDYQAMGFSVDQASLEVEADRKKKQETDEEMKKTESSSSMDQKKAVKTSKKEQDDLI